MAGIDNFCGQRGTIRIQMALIEAMMTTNAQRVAEQATLAVQPDPVWAGLQF